jgi:hypothetical protein
MYVIPWNSSGLRLDDFSSKLTSSRIEITRRQVTSKIVELIVKNATTSVVDEDRACAGVVGVEVVDGEVVGGEVLGVGGEGGDGEEGAGGGADLVANLEASRRGPGLGSGVVEGVSVGGVDSGAVGPLP